MKKQFLFATLALATMFTACSKEEELSKNEGGTPVNFVIGGIGARTVTDANYVTTFESGDIIGLFGSGFKDGASFVNKAYTVNSDLSGLTAPEGESTYYMGEENPTIYAYRPYNSSYTSTTVEHIVCTDQSITQENDVTIDGFNGSDFMVATTTIEGSTISLTFEHKMAMVELNFGENLSALGVSQVSMRTINGIKYNLATNETTLQDGIINVNMYNVATNKFWAIVPPQTVTGDGNTVLFTITAGGRTFYYTPADDATETFTANKVRKITLDIAGTGDDDTATAAVFKLASVTVNNWGTEEDENTTTVVEKKMTVEPTISSDMTIMTKNGTGDNATAITNRNQITEGSWGIYGLASAEYDNTYNGIKIVSLLDNTSNKSWYNSTLFYRANANELLIPGQTYTLTVKYKSTSDLHVFVCKASDGVVYGRAGTGASFVTATKQSSLETEGTCTLDIDPSWYLTSATSVSTTNVKQTSNAPGDFLIGIRPVDNDNNSQITAYITSVTLVQD